MSRAAWARPARLGGLWAASEIVLGSFLHNLRVPLRGHVMTALSAVLLAAAHARRPVRGLLWRAGLVCAALKSVSPSAVLIGPMVAITAEGFLMEAGTVLLGGAAGRALGGGLAMAWIPVHLAGRAAILYGLDAAKLYEAAWGRVAVADVGPWELLGLVWALHFVTGVAAVALAPLLSRAPGVAATAPVPPRPGSWSVAAPRYGTSTAALLLDAALIVAGLKLLKTLPAPQAAAFAAAAVALWAYLYPGAVRRLSRPGLWLGVLIVGVSAGALLGEGGREAGLRMALRALFLSAAFAALSQELAAPAVRSRLVAWGARGWLDAVSGAFASLPALVARLPPAPVLLRRPSAALASLLDAAEPPALHLVVGPSGAGKTAFLAALADAARARGLSVAGVLSPGAHEGGVRTSFDVVDLSTGRRLPLSRRDGPAPWPRLAGPFHFSPEGVALGRDALAAAGAADLVIVDEVGPLELSGGGWAAQLDELALTRRGPMFWAVRESLADAVQARWSAPAVATWSASSEPAAALEAAGLKQDARAEEHGARRG